MSDLHVAMSIVAAATGGPATYGIRLAQVLGRLEGVRLTVLTDRAGIEGLVGCGVVVVPSRGGIDRLRWQYVALPRALRSLDCAVFHDTKNALPPSLRVPAVVTVHDLAYHRCPGSFGLASRWFLRIATQDAVRRAARIVVPSAATARDVADIHAAHADRVRIVPHGIDPFPGCAKEDLDRVRRQHALPERFVLHVGTVQARKNVDVLIAAVRMLRERGWPQRCVIAGRRGWRSTAAFAEIERDDTAMYLGEVPIGDLPALYSLADAFASPSAYEGFGFTVADALAAGTPVVVSDTSSLPEVCGDAALVVPEATAAAFADGLERVLGEAELRRALIAAGPRRAAEFSWELAARQTLAVYREALDS